MLREQKRAYYNDNLYFTFDLCEETGKLALGLSVNDSSGALLVKQAYPFSDSGTAASWLFYWQLLAAAGREEPLKEGKSPTYWLGADGEYAN